MAENEVASRFQELIDSRNLAALEEYWMSVIEVEEPVLPESEVLVAAAGAFLEAAEGERADVLLELTLPLYEERQEPAKLLGLLRSACLAAPEKEQPRHQFVRCFKEVHGATSAEAVYVTLANVEGAADVRRAFADLDRWMLYREGSYVHHGSGWGTGQIVAIDPLLRRATVNLEKRPNHTMDLAAVGSVLEPLPDDHFRALQYRGGERLQEMRDSDPVALIDTVLRSFGNPLELKVIKSHVVPAVLPADAWPRWWSRAKKALRESELFRVEDRSPFAVTRLERAVSYEEDLRASFAKANWKERRVLARKALKAGSRKLPQLVTTIRAELGDVVRAQPGPRALEAAHILQKHGLTLPGDENGSAPVVTALRGAPEPVAAVLGTDGADEQRTAVRALAELFEGERWHEAALHLLEVGSDAVRGAVCDLARDTLRDRMVERIRSAMESPRAVPDLFVWSLRSALAGKRAGLFPDVAELMTGEFFDRVLDLMEHLSIKVERDRDESVREVLSRLRSLVNENADRLLGGTIEGLDRRDARLLYERLLRSGGLSGALRVQLLDTATRTRSEVTRPADVPIWEEKTIYVTPAGLHRREEELRDLMENKLPEVFRDIGRAAAFGDLSENAEYKAALEKRDFLTRRAEEIQAELRLASLITPAMLRDGEVTLGSRVTLMNLETDKEEVFRILGPWDGDPGGGVISYRSPMGQVFLGARVDDEVEARLPAGIRHFRVLRIEPGLEE